MFGLILAGLGHFLGLDNPSGAFYLWWSGPGSDISELLLVGTFIAMIRRHNCEVHGCWRLGRHPVFDPTHNVTHHVCRRHHPRTNLTADYVQDLGNGVVDDGSNGTGMAFAESDFGRGREPASQFDVST